MAPKDMAVLCNVSLLALGLTLLGSGVQSRGNGRGLKEVSGSATVYLGQDSDLWRPLIHTTVNLSDVISIKSSFRIRTFDPEGVIFYGDTKGGQDWFVLALKDGVPLMQISQGSMHVSVAAGPKLNDGKWHTVELSNQELFVVLEVDGSNKVVVGMHVPQTKEAMAGDLRMALGGILIDSKRLMVQLTPRLDGCVREGVWLNLTIPWQTEADELWPCYQNIQPGTYFPGHGFAIFNTSVFPFDTNVGVKMEVEGDFSQMDGTIFSIKAPGKELTIALVANNDTQEITLTYGEEKISFKNTLKRLVITFQESPWVFEEHPKLADYKAVLLMNLDVLNTWKDGHLAIGSLLGEGKDNSGSQFLTGCLKKIWVQGRDLDLDLATEQKSVSSHSCPA